MEEKPHHPWTVAAIACLAFIAADLSHEVIGHGVTAFLLGARHLLLSSTYLSSDINSRTVDAAGTIVNLFEGTAALILLPANWKSIHRRYFLWLLAAFNLLDGTGYFLFSALTNSGDWAEVVRGTPHAQYMRVGMGLLGAAGYWLSAYLCARALAPFAESRNRLATLPYWTVLLVNCTAAALNPLGWKYILVSALPATAGANAALLFLPEWAKRLSAGREPGLEPRSDVLRPSLAWIVAGALATALFIGIIGPGIHWDRT